MFVVARQVRRKRTQESFLAGRTTYAQSLPGLGSRGRRASRDRRGAGRARRDPAAGVDLSLVEACAAWLASSVPSNRLPHSSHRCTCCPRQPLPRSSFSRSWAVTRWSSATAATSSRARASRRAGQIGGGASPNLSRSPTRDLVVGTDADNKTPSGLWPSDHAGVVATLNP